MANRSVIVTQVTNNGGVYDHSIETNLSVKIIGALLRQINDIDKAIASARPHLVTLQPTREGRLDVRYYSARHTPGTREPRFVKWMGKGDGRRQHAKIVSPTAAFKGVRIGRGEARAKYASARLLVSRLAAAIETRGELMLALRTLQRSVAECAASGACSKLVSATADVTSLSDRTIAEYLDSKMS